MAVLSTRVPISSMETCLIITIVHTDPFQPSIEPPTHPSSHPPIHPTKQYLLVPPVLKAKWQHNSRNAKINKCVYSTFEFIPSSFRLKLPVTLLFCLDVSCLPPVTTDWMKFFYLPKHMVWYAQMHTADTQTDLRWPQTRSPWCCIGQSGGLGSSNLSISGGKIQDGLQALGGGGGGLRPEGSCLSLWLQGDEIWGHGSLRSHSVRRDRAGRTKGRALITASNMVTWPRRENDSAEGNVVHQLFSAKELCGGRNTTSQQLLPLPPTLKILPFFFVLRFGNFRSLYSTSLSCPSRRLPRVATKWLCDLELQCNAVPLCLHCSICGMGATVPTLSSLSGARESSVLTSTNRSIL